MKRTTDNPFYRLPSRRDSLVDFTKAALAGLFVSHEVLLHGQGVLAAEAKVAGNWGTVKGQIVYDEKSKLPEVREVDFSKIALPAEDRKFFTSKGKVVHEDWVIDPKSRGIRHVYVWLRPDSPDKTINKIATIHPDLSKPAVKEVVMDQESLGFRPHALALRAGQTLHVKNTSPISHAVAWNSLKNGANNRLMPSKSEFKMESLQPENLPIMFSCAPHPWERAWMRVFDHPYFALTDMEGKFEIKLAPGGKCRLVVWQETLGFKDGAAGRLGQPIKIEAGATLDLGKLFVKPTE